MERIQPVIRPYAWGSRHAIAETPGPPGPGARPGGRAVDGRPPVRPVRRGRDHPGRRRPPPPTRTASSARRAWPGSAPGCRSCSRCSQPTRPCPSSCTPPAPRPRPLRAGNVNYVDDWPKPELLCALTPFEVLAGLRPRSTPRPSPRPDVPALQPLAGELDAATAPGPSAAPWPPSSNGPKTPAKSSSLRHHRLRHLASSDSPYAGACAAAVREAGHRPGDLGLVAMLLMRMRRSPPARRFHARRRPARLPAGHRHRDAGQLRQRGPAA